MRDITKCIQSEYKEHPDPEQFMDHIKCYLMLDRSHNTQSSKRRKGNCLNDTPFEQSFGIKFGTSQMLMFSRPFYLIEFRATACVRKSNSFIAWVLFTYCLSDVSLR